MEQLHGGAQTMLAYFHYCNKGVQPFILAPESDEVFSIAELDSSQIKYIREMAKEVKKRGNAAISSFAIERGMYD
jgi:hypothetical protein